MSNNSIIGCTCGGVGTVERDGKLYGCVCEVLRRRMASMPSYIRVAEVKSKHLEYDLHNNTRKSLFITSSWTDMKSIIKATMIKNFNLFVRATSDNDILHAYVGAMSKKVKGENEASYENVSDYVGPPDLLIIRLNAITRPNKAAAGALEEAIILRMDVNKATWLVSDTSRLFNSSSPAYSDSVKDAISVFPRITVVPIITSIPNVDIEQSAILPEPVKPSISDDARKKSHNELKQRVKN